MGKRTVSVVTLVIMVLILVSAVGWMAVSNEETQFMEHQVVSESVETSPILSEVNLVTFANKEYGIAFEHPDDIALDVDIGTHKDCVWDGSFQPHHSVGKNGDKLHILTFCFYKNTSLITLTDYAELSYRNWADLFAPVILPSGFPAIEGRSFDGQYSSDKLGYVLIVRLPNGNVVTFQTKEREYLFKILKQSIRSY